MVISLKTPSSLQIPTQYPPFNMTECTIVFLSVQLTNIKKTPTHLILFAFVAHILSMCRCRSVSARVCASKFVFIHTSGDERNDEYATVKERKLSWLNLYLTGRPMQTTGCPQLYSADFQNPNMEYSFITDWHALHMKSYQKHPVRLSELQNLIWHLM